MSYAVCVTFKLKPGTTEPFLVHMREQADTSVAEEPGCRQFDVCTDPARPEHVFLYEIYVSKDAFDVHLQSAHFASFDAAVRDMVEDKQVTTFSEVFP